MLLIPVCPCSVYRTSRESCQIVSYCLATTKRESELVADTMEAGIHQSELRSCCHCSSRWPDHLRSSMAVGCCCTCSGCCYCSLAPFEAESGMLLAWCCCCMLVLRQCLVLPNLRRRQYAIRKMSDLAVHTCAHVRLASELSAATC